MRIKSLILLVSMSSLVLMVGCPGGTPPGLRMGDIERDFNGTDGQAGDTVGSKDGVGKDVMPGDTTVPKDGHVIRDTHVTPDTITPKDVQGHRDSITKKDTGVTGDVHVRDMHVTDTGLKDTAVVPPTNEDCKPCTRDTDCSDAFDCMKLGSQKFCLRKCIQGNGDCPPGYVCKNYCVPQSNQCTGCLVDGCPQGKVCDPNTGKCQDKKGVCDKCSSDWECGDKARCLRIHYSYGLCMPQCKDKSDCPDPAKYECKEDSSGNKVCQPDDPSVCCPPDKPIMLMDGTCVQCYRDRQCPQGQVCDRNTFICHTPCPQGQMACPDDNKCHECCSNQDCPGHQKCTDHKCTGDICGCSTDRDCNTGGGYSQASLKCDPSGFCYNPTGQCDGQTSCCNTKSGSTCFDLGSLFSGGGGFGGGGFGGGGFGGNMGVCTCDNGAKCPAGVKCTSASAICNIPMVGGWICPNGQLPANAPKHICGDPTQWLGGGGGFMP